MKHKQKYGTYMKICLVAPRVGKVKGVFLGGSTNNLINLSRELAKQHEVHLIILQLPFQEQFSLEHEQDRNPLLL